MATTATIDIFPEVEKSTALCKSLISKAKAADRAQITTTLGANTALQLGAVTEHQGPPPDLQSKLPEGNFNDLGGMLGSAGPAGKRPKRLGTPWLEGDARASTLDGKK